MIVDINPQISERLTKAARTKGIDPTRLVENLLADSLPPAEPALESTPAPTISAKNAAAIAMLHQWIAEDATDDPEEIRKSEAEVEELMQNLNKNRIDSGESPLFP